MVLVGMRSKEGMNQASVDHAQPSFSSLQAHRQLSSTHLEFQESSSLDLSHCWSSWVLLFWAVVVFLQSAA